LIAAFGQCYSRFLNLIAREGIVVIAVLLTIGTLVITPQAISAQLTIDHHPMTYVMLLNPECDWEFRDRFDEHMRVNNTQYEKYLDSYQVICLGGVKNLEDVDSYVVPNLRYILPYDRFVFVYPDSMLEQFHDYIEGKYGSQYRYLALGNTDVPNGIAYVSEVPANVKHEIAHLDTCGTWHNDKGEDIGRLVKHPEADLLPWCPH